jgi:hypothetical protein
MDLAATLPGSATAQKVFQTHCLAPGLQNKYRRNQLTEFASMAIQIT